MDAPPAQEGGGAAPQMGDAPAEHAHPKILANQTPMPLAQAYFVATEFIGTYGWFIVAAIALLYYLKQRFAPQIDDYRRRKEEMTYLNVDPDVARRRQDAMEARTRRMQEEHDAKAALLAEKEKLKEEQKRKDKIEDFDRQQDGRGTRSRVKKEEEQPSTSNGSSLPKKKPATYRSNDYNPMLGGGGGGAYRPERRRQGGG